MRRLRDDTGAEVSVPDAVERVVSLVPSLTETVAVTAPGLLVGATDWCTHPADLDVVRIKGTKNPDVEAIAALHPDLVLANAEENRRPDLDALQAAGVPVWVTDVRTLDGAFTSLGRMIDTCGLRRPAWLDDAALGVGRRPSARAAPHEPSSRSGGGPGWRSAPTPSPAPCSAGSAWTTCSRRHRTATPGSRWTALPDVDLVVLPDEPYRFTRDDGPEAFPGVPAALVSGRHLTWYGPSLVEAPDVLRAQLLSG